MDALDAAFYKAFEYVEPTNKRWLLGIDISGSMAGASCHGAEMLRVSQAAAAMAMFVMRSEPLYEVIGYDTRAYDLKLSAGMRLPDVISCVGLPDGRGTLRAVHEIGKPDPSTPRSFAAPYFSFAGCGGAGRTFVGTFGIGVSPAVSGPAPDGATVLG